MKAIVFLISFFFGVLVSSANPDTLFLYDGNVLVGRALQVDPSGVVFEARSGPFGENAAKYYPFEFIRNAHLSSAPMREKYASAVRLYWLGQGHTYPHDNSAYLAGRSLRRFGTYFYSGAAAMFVGGGLTTTGALTGIPALTWTGAGVGGAGGAVCFISFTSVLKAGTFLKKGRR